MVVLVVRMMGAHRLVGVVRVPSRRRRRTVTRISTGYHRYKGGGGGGVGGRVVWVKGGRDLGGLGEEEEGT